MSKFKLLKVIKLDRFGKEWEGAYLSFTAPSWAEAVAATKAGTSEEKAEEVNRFLREHFVEGKAPGEAGLVDVKVTDIPELPGEVIATAMNELNGAKLDPNISTP